MFRASLRCAAPSLVLCLVVLLPFLGKAYTIDDPTFIAAADHVLAHPLHPGDFTLSQDGGPTQFSWLRYLTTAYVLLPAAALDNAEWAAHGMMLLLLLAAVWGSCTLALRMGLAAPQASLVGLMVATAPASLVLASTIMPDTPALAFGVWAVERTWAWKGERRWHQGVAVALLLAAATLARSHALLLLGVCFLGLMDGEGDWRRFLPVAVAAALMAVLYRLANVGSHAQGLNVAFGTQKLSNSFALGTHWALTVPFAAAYVLARPRIFLGPLPYVMAGVSCALLVGDHQPAQNFWLIPLAAMGMATVADACFRALRGDATQRALAFWLLLPLPLIFYDHLPCKYLGPALPGAAILIARALPGGWRRVVVTRALPIVGLVLALLVTLTDARFAGADREAAQRLVAGQPNAFVDGSFGFQYYAVRAGAQVLTGHPRARPGSRVVRPHFHTSTLDHYPNRALVRTEDGPWSGFHIMTDGAGFYSNGWAGFMPLTWRRGPLNRYELWILK